MKALIVTGGQIDLEFFKASLDLQESPLLIAVDHGVDAFYAIGLLPDVMLGDFDSINPDVLDYFVGKQVKVFSYPPEKDMTDTCLAMEYAMEQGVTEVTLLGGLGTRMDHTLSNLFSLEKYLDRVHYKIKDPHNEIELLKDYGYKILEKNDYPFISLLPLTDVVKGVTTQGFKYELDAATLFRTSSRGISNELVGQQGTVNIKEGRLILIRSRD